MKRRVVRLLAAATGFAVVAAGAPDGPTLPLPGSAPGARHFYPQHFNRDGAYVPPHYGAAPKPADRSVPAGHWLPPAEPIPVAKP